MNPFLTANLRADRELRASIHKQELKAIQGQLESALPFLQKAYETGEKAGLEQVNYELLQALGDALTACNEAIERCDDVPDDVCDVAVEHLSPIAGIAQPPESAF